MIITISGTPGSGKSSIAKALTKTLGAKLFNAGQIRREYAKDNGLTLTELNKKAEKDPTSDRLVDEKLKELVLEKDDMVVDARLGFYFIPTSIKVFVDADEEIRAQRILKRHDSAEVFKDIKETLVSLKKRVDSDKKRYMALYSIDPYQEAHYDLVVDSSSKSIEKIAGDIYRFARFKQHRLN